MAESPGTEDDEPDIRALIENLEDEAERADPESVLFALLMAAASALGYQELELTAMYRVLETTTTLHEERIEEVAKLKDQIKELKNELRASRRAASES
jgi:hypothetical protein